MVTFPCSIPHLPASAILWPANLLLAHNSLSEIYQHALRVWEQEDADSLQLEFHLCSLEGDAMDLLGAIKSDPIGPELTEWLTSLAELVGQLYAAITSYRDSIQNQ